MKKRITKRNWYSDELENGKAKAPSASPSDENHLDGLNRGEIHLNDNSDDPTIFIRDNKGNIIGFKPGGNLEDLKKLFLGKYGPDRTNFLMQLFGGLEVKGGMTSDSILVKSSLTSRQLKSMISDAIIEEGDPNVLGLDLIEEGDGNPDVMSLALMEDTSDFGGGASTLGELDNVDPLVDTAPVGSLLVKEATNWESAFPSESNLIDYQNMLMPVFHKVLGKWIFISVSSITGGGTHPTIEMILDAGVLDVNKLS